MANKIKSAATFLLNLSWKFLKLLPGLLWKVVKIGPTLVWRFIKLVPFLILPILFAFRAESKIGAVVGIAGGAVFLGWPGAVTAGAAFMLIKPLSQLVSKWYIAIIIIGLIIARVASGIDTQPATLMSDVIDLIGQVNSTVDNLRGEAPGVQYILYPTATPKPAPTALPQACSQVNPQVGEQVSISMPNGGKATFESPGASAQLPYVVLDGTSVLLLEGPRDAGDGFGNWWRVEITVDGNKHQVWITEASGVGSPAQTCNFN